MSTTSTGAALPSGYLSTAGSQIVDSSGNPVRIASTGWFDGWGNIPGSVAAMRAAGFNTVRVSWVNAAMQSDLQRIDQVVAAAKANGMKVILDNHTNEVGHSPQDNYGAQQVNGLWYDQGGASDGTDGGGNHGTVSQAKFQSDWVQVAQHYAGNDTVIGFDIRNEPLGWGHANWGSGDPNRDERLMYQQVGDAIQKVNPGPLIIAEGVIDYSQQTNGVTTPWGLSKAGAQPVVLDTPNKVVYSVHDYPVDVSGLSPDSGAANVAMMNADWGYLVKGNIAPVWIGEMGASMVSGAQSAWAQTLLDYMNGKDGAQGGPTFSGNQQPVSGDWWAWGAFPGQNPDGTLNPDGSLNAAQQAVWTQMLYTPSAAAPVPPVNNGPASADNTVVTTVGAKIIDAKGNAWTLTADGRVAVNGSPDATTARVTTLAYEKGVVWQENADKLWWSKTSPSDVWGPNGGTATNPVPVAPPKPVQSQDNTVVMGPGTPIIDAAGNAWAITAGGQVSVNGTADTTTGRVTELAYEKGQVWQENADKLWWSKTAPADTWGPNNGTPVSPVPAVPTPPTPAAPSIDLTTAAGYNLSIDGTTVGHLKAGGDVISLTSPGVASVALGQTAESIKFVSMSSITLAAGTAAATVSADGGTNVWISGQAALSVTGGGGVDAFVYHSGNATMTIAGYTPGVDTLAIDKSLQASMTVAADKAGGTMLTFGTGGGIDLKGYTGDPRSLIHWS